MARNEKTTKEIATLSSKLLKDPKTPKKVKKVAASNLTQAPDKRKLKRGK